MATKKTPTLANNKLPRLDFLSLIYWAMPLGKDYYYYYYYPIHLGLQFLSSLQLAFDLKIRNRSIFNAKTHA